MKRIHEKQQQLYEKDSFLEAYLNVTHETALCILRDNSLVSFAQFQRFCFP